MSLVTPTSKRSGSNYITIRRIKRIQKMKRNGRKAMENKGELLNLHPNPR